LLGSLGGQGADIIGSHLANQLKDRQFSFQRPSVEVEVRQFPSFSMQPYYSEENKTASIHTLHADITAHPTSKTMGPYSEPTTAVPHAAAPTPATHPRLRNPATDQPALYTAPTASAPYGSTASGLCRKVGDDNVLCPFDPSFLTPIFSSDRGSIKPAKFYAAEPQAYTPPPAPHVQHHSGNQPEAPVYAWIDSYFVRDDVKKCFHRFYFYHLSSKPRFQECVYPTNDF